MNNKYNISTEEILFAQGEKFNVMEVANRQQPWWNRTLCTVNDSVIRLGVIEGDFHWHKHDKEDELFLVMEGELDIELEDRMISLKAGDAVVIPAGVMHCPHARGRVSVLLVEPAGVIPTGDA